MTDMMVLKTQQWLNKTYKGRYNFGSVTEDGATGWETINALIRALQIELGITQTVNNFGPGTTSRFKSRWPSGIAQQAAGAKDTSNVYAIIQGALWCKGYSVGSAEITTHFYGGTGAAIKKMKADMGIGGDSHVDVLTMKSLLSMDQFKLLVRHGANSSVRNIQQTLNGKYRTYTGIIPADGLYGRQMNTALIQVLQKLEGYSPSQATGNFGAGTRKNLKTVSSSSSGEWVWLASAALVCNRKAVQVTSTWDNSMANAVKSFQKDYALPVTGVVDTTTWMSLLTSKGNPDRVAKACDCATVLSARQAKDLKNAGYTHVGRYLTGTVGKERRSKALNIDEIKNITATGLSVFPIYQDGGYYSDYFSYAGQGNIDGLTAIGAAKALGFPRGTTIYFAVDFDAYEFQIDKLILPYFKRIKAAFNSAENSKAYKVGIYGPRLVCSKVTEAGYASYSFVADMSTGFSGNLGYPIPRNWAFDQFHEFTFHSSPAFPLDKDAYSGRDKATKTFDKVPYKSAHSLEYDNAFRLIDAAKKAFVQAVLEPLNLFEQLSTIHWRFDQKIPLNTFNGRDVTIVTSMVASVGIGTTSSNPNAIDIKVNNDGTLTAGTRSAISSASAKFKVKDLGTNLDFSQRITSIAASIKGGNISTSLTSSGPTNFTGSITVTSPELAPKGSGLSEHVTVTLSYEVTFHPHTSPDFHLPEVSVDGALVGVAVVALAVLFVAGAVASGGTAIPAEGALLEGLAGLAVL
ncbi:hypothetical protein BK816_01060 [Boudabousia tangfeifanii]|nr:MULTISPECIES: glycoside hydrolase domain-containing protein [Boudabousia]AOZ72055.1 hypothetical protein BK816_01060 [Boudabousia tangfeifanii]